MATITVDAGGGGDYTTIQAGCDAATAGDTVQVNTGTYNENVDIDINDGTAGSRITLQASSGATVTMSPGSGTYVFKISGKDYWTFDFNGFVITPTANMSFFYYTSPVGNTVTNPIIKNATVTDTNIYYLVSASAGGDHVDDLVVQDCILKNCQRGLVQLGNNARWDGTVIERCYLYNFPTNRHGIIIPGATAANYTVTVRNCILAKGGYGIYDYNTQNAYTLNCYNNTIYDMALDGIYLGSGTKTSTYNIKNNIIDTCDDYGIDDPNTSATYDIDYNCWNNNSTGDIRNESLGAHAQEGDPGMTDEASEDYTLDGTGLADDNGVDLSGTGFSDDYAGTTRSGSWDIGAYNYSATSRRVFIIS